jgi:hypothetical protein
VACYLSSEVVVKALCSGRLCRIVEVSSDITLEESGREFVVPLSDEALVIDPTDNEVADATNLRELYGLDDDAADRFRRMLRGESSVQ